MLQVWKRLGRCKQMKGTGHADGRLKKKNSKGLWKDRN